MKPGSDDKPNPQSATPKVDAVAPVDAFVTDSDHWAVSKTDYDCLLDVAREQEREAAFWKAKFYGEAVPACIPSAADPLADAGKPMGTPRMDAQLEALKGETNHNVIFGIFETVGKQIERELAEAEALNRRAAADLLEMEGRLIKAATPLFADAELAQGVLTLTKTVRYLVGIAERGEGRAMGGDETAEQFVLRYVQRLEKAAPLSASMTLPKPTTGSIGGLEGVWIDPRISYIWGFSGSTAKYQAKNLADSIQRHLESLGVRCVDDATVGVSGSKT